ncbi:MAG TPA: hypothetical protein P5514_05325 [Bacteroidales bacterium]|nr:hypothetical protein [Bacteroidales bacterium]HRX96345.1 hypothetical protein [Bacteroidales bacterium]
MNGIIKQVNKYNSGSVLPVLICLLVLVNLSKGLMGQNANYDYKTVDEKTLELYNESRWDYLIFYGEEAIKNGQDYYYLRLRIGIAYYNQTNYFMAVVHFEKAFTYNHNDPVLLEYLYYAYTFINRSLEARKLIPYFSETLLEKTGEKKSNIISDVAVNTGFVLSNNVNKNEIREQNKKQDSSYFEQTLNDNKLLIQVDLGLNLSKKIKAKISYLNLNTNKLQQVRTSELTITGTYTQVIPPAIYQGNIYSYDISLNNLKYTMNQHGIYGSVSYNAGHGIIISPAFNFLNISYDNLVTNFTEELYLAQPWHTDESSTMVYTVAKKDTSFSNYITSLNISKTVSKNIIGFTGSYSNLNGLTQYQGDLSLSWFPGGNLNFYGTSRLTGAFEQENQKLRFLFYQSLGFKLSEKLWAEIYGTFGEMVNFNEANAYVVFNSGDILKFRAGVNFIVPLSSKIQLSIRYYLSSHQGYAVSGYNPESFTVSTIKYENQLFLGGISWKL